MEKGAPSASSSKSPPEGRPASAGVLKTLQEFSEEHELDPNLPLEEINAVEAAVATRDAEKAQELEANLEEDSPYPEVRLEPPMANLRWSCASRSLVLQ